MKIVTVVEFGCQLSSKPLLDKFAEELRLKLESKGLICYTVEATEKKK